MKTIYKLFLIGYFTFSFSANAAVAPLLNPQIKKTQNTEQTEIKLLKTQLEVQRAFQGDLLATVYWSLGTLASIAVLLVGLAGLQTSKYMNVTRTR